MKERREWVKLPSRRSLGDKEKMKCPSVEKNLFVKNWKPSPSDIVIDECVWHLLSEDVSICSGNTYHKNYVHHGMDTGVNAIFVPEEKTLYIRESTIGAREDWAMVEFHCENFQEAAIIAHASRSWFVI